MFGLKNKKIILNNTLGSASQLLKNSIFMCLSLWQLIRVSYEIIVGGDKQNFGA